MNINTIVLVQFVMSVLSVSSYIVCHPYILASHLTAGKVEGARAPVPQCPLPLVPMPMRLVEAHVDVISYKVQDHTTSVYVEANEV